MVRGIEVNGGTAVGCAGRVIEGPRRAAVERNEETGIERIRVAGDDRRAHSERPCVFEGNIVDPSGREWIPRILSRNRGSLPGTAGLAACEGVPYGCVRAHETVTGRVLGIEKL